MIKAQEMRPQGSESAAFEAALDRLRRACADAGSDALVVLRRGELVCEDSFGTAREPIESMSITKSVVSLAIGRLIDQGKIPSVDTPMHHFFPSWGQGSKQSVTLRHVLQHTSGLRALRTTADIYPAPDFIKLALETELVSEPGEVFFYNNKAVNLLAGVVQHASGRRLDQYCRDELFAPLGITDIDWALDRAGNPHAMSGLRIHPIDLARLGELMRLRGAFAGQRVVSEAWVDASLTPLSSSERCGLLWWIIDGPSRFTVTDELLACWESRGVPGPALAKLAKLRGQSYTMAEYSRLRADAFGGSESSPRMQREFWGRVGRRDGERVWGPAVGYNANGGMGQWLVVLPRRGLVAVRMRREGTGPDPDPKREARLVMPGFVDLVRALAPDPGEDSPWGADGPWWLRGLLFLRRLRG